jgi:hypothetical protein
MMMDILSLLRAGAAILTIIAALLVAGNWSPRTMVLGFTIFIVASIAWIVDGWLEDKLSLLIQNIVLLGINIFGVWRWLPKA